jgi:hypothetical protein
MLDAAALPAIIAQLFECTLSDGLTAVEVGRNIGFVQLRETVV